MCPEPRVIVNRQGVVVPIGFNPPRRSTVETARLSADAVRQILLKRAGHAGVKGSLAEPITPHGLRAGFVTTAYRNGVPDEEIMGHTRHRSLTTMRSYVRRAKLSGSSTGWKGRAVTGVGSVPYQCGAPDLNQINGLLRRSTARPCAEAQVAHENVRTAEHCARTKDSLTQDEVEQIK
jgi:hypothetical protein